MKQVTSSITGMIRRADAAFRRRLELDCDAAQQLMSPFIDSMASPAEVELLENHLSGCEPCQRQLQAFISIRNLLAGVDRPLPSEDSVLETRVRLSQERYRDYLAKLENRVANVLRPIAIPAICGVSLTMIGFAVLLAVFSNPTAVMARDNSYSGGSRLYSHARTTDPTMVRFAVSSDVRNWDDPLMIETHVGEDGKVIDFNIISGPQNPEIDKWLQELLYYASFTPATSFGKPVDSKIILSFVAVRS